MDFLAMADSLWKIVVVGLVVGAGLPALFALGLRALSPAVVSSGAPSTVAAGSNGSTRVVNAESATGVGVGRKLLAGLCFAVVIAAIVVGILFIAGLIGK